MCGRFFVYDETTDAIERMVREVKVSVRTQRITGDIHPTECAAVISPGPNGMIADVKRWGFPGFENPKVLINARAETVMERKMFRDSVMHRRIIIPAAGFYEWNRQKEKVTFTEADVANDRASLLFIAGFYNRFEGEERFIILTTDANESMRDVHDRMPLILERDDLKLWLYEDEKVEELLCKEPGRLHRKMEYEQQRLF